MEYGQPVASKSSRYKYSVRVYDRARGRDKIVSFGHKGYEDFTEHGDWERRRKYLARSAQIKDWRGRLTKDDPLSANYWSRRFLWASGEKMYKVTP